MGTTGYSAIFSRAEYIAKRQRFDNQLNSLLRHGVEWFPPLVGVENPHPFMLKMFFYKRLGN